MLAKPVFYCRCIWFCLFHACPTRTNQSSAVRLINCSRGIVAWLNLVQVCLAYCISHLGSAIICEWHYVKKINRLYDICVNMCMGPLNWIVSFQWVLYPWLWEKFRHRLGWFRVIFAPTKFVWKLLLIRKHFFFGVEFFIVQSECLKTCIFYKYIFFSKSHYFY